MADKNKFSKSPKNKKGFKFTGLEPKMGSRKMGRHRSAEEEREVSTLRKKQGGEKSLSKMRTTCKSHTNDKFAKGECC
jgi:hypothetical protein